jgi:cell division protein FtsW
MARTLKSDRMLFWSTLLLVGVSLIMVYSASAVQSMNTNHAPYYVLLRQSAWVALGLPLLLGAQRLDYRRYREPALIWTLLGVTAVLLLATFFFPTRNGTQRWLTFGTLSVQPSELAKLAAIIFTAALLERRMHRISDVNYALLPVIIVTVGLASLIMLEPDFGTATMLVLVVSVVVFAAGVSYRHLLTAGMILVPTAIGLIFAAGYRTTRLLAFFDPSRDLGGANFQMNQSLIAVGSGGTFGKGLMSGVQKVYYIPEPHTDFIYAVIGEELGLIGCTIILLCFVVIAWRGFRTSLLAPDRFGALLALGLTAMVALQALVNMSVILGMLPTKGIPLPFVSNGGSSLVVNLLAMGILLNISQQASADRVRDGELRETRDARSGVERRAGVGPREQLINEDLLNV